MPARRMRVIFSRKGFDSTYGRAPSPIVDGRPISMPIPADDRSETTYGDIGLGELATQVTNRRITSASLCHHDPMFENGRCAFGQVGAAQSHLKNNDVGVGDIFLFFGLFSELGRRDLHHRIFGYLQIEQIVTLGETPTETDQPEGFSRRHPHTIGHWNSNNTLYIGKGSCARGAQPNLRLTHSDGPLTRWVVPNWVWQNGLTYHGNPKRWQDDGTLKACARGQEFIAELGRRKDALNWVRQTVETISACNTDHALKNS